MFIQFPEPYLLTQHTFYLALLITDRISPLNLIFVLLLASTHEEFTDEQRTQGPSKQNLLGILVSWSNSQILNHMDQNAFLW
jgi:hypothetical protein